LERKTYFQKKQLTGYNSYIASAPYDEFQIDLMFFCISQDQKYKNALLMIDIFSKFILVNSNEIKMRRRCAGCIIRRISRDERST
jgi:hypothetical protein